MKQKRKLLPYLYCSPAFILIALVVVFPILYTAYISVTNMNLYHWTDYEIIGLDNYVRTLTNVSSGFLTALLTTLVWTVLNMVIQVTAAYFIALGLNKSGLKGKRIYKTLLMFPWAMPAYVSILLWRVGIYNTEFGLLNKILVALGLSKRDFLATNLPAFLCCMVLNLWMALPFMITMIDGALQSIDKSYLESAELEGAGFWVKNVSIIIPSIKGIIAPAVVMTTFTTFKQFDIVYLLTLQKGSHSGATLQTVITYAHQNAFVSNNYGLSSSVSIILFLMIMVFSIFTNRGVKEESYE